MSGGTPKGRALGRALRQERVDRGIGLRTLAQRMNRDPGLLSRWETGERTPPPETVARILTLLDVPHACYDDIIGMAHDLGNRHWVAVTLPEQRRQLDALASVERTASEIIEVAPLLICGLLQSPGYLRAVLAGGNLLSRNEFEARREIREHRQQALTRPQPVRLTALIGEAALRTRIGGAATMAEQCRHLLAMAERPNIDLRVVTFTSGWRPSLHGPFSVVESEADVPAAYLEIRRTPILLHTREDIADYRQAAATERRAALPATDSTAMIRHYLATWEQSTTP